MVQPSSPGASSPDWLLTHHHVKQQQQQQQQEQQEQHQQEGLQQTSFQLPLSLDWARTVSRDDVKPLQSLPSSMLDALIAAAASAAIDPRPYPKVGGGGAGVVGELFSGLPDMPFVVHNTYQFYKDAGKRARFREGHMWALDSDE